MASRAELRNEHRFVEVDAPAEYEEGLPEPCPSCGGRGYLERIDLARGYKHESCVECHHWWRTPLPKAPNARPANLGRSTRTGLAARLGQPGALRRPTVVD